MENTKINSKIVGQEVVKDESEKSEQLRFMNEKLERPKKLHGTTYKIKTPVSDHAMYVTINDIVLNEGTQYEQRYPFEIFINSKNMEHYQWIVALTRIMSSVFRKGGDVTFLVEELNAVFDPKGGYWRKGKYVNSFVAEIGDVVEQHLQEIGLLGLNEQESTVQIYDSKDDANDQTVETPMMDLCPKCFCMTLKNEGGCSTCINCGHSKCE